jgi:arabinofuranan 3-O-arabinosyltransferase
VCLWQDGPAECAPLPSPPGAPGWAEYTALTRLAPDVLGARLYLYAEPSAGPGEVEYRDVSVTPLRPVGSAAVSPRPAPATQLTLAGGRHVVRVDRQGSAAPPDLPEFRACPSPGARPSPYPTADRRPLLPDGTLTLNAPSYGLCAEADTVPVVPNATYRLSVDYRTDYGQTPRLCIREDPAMRCAGTPVLTRASGWQTVQATIRPAPGTTTIRPQLDADATYMVSGRVSYRGFRLARVAPVAVEVTPTEPGGTGARVESTAVSPTEYRVAVHGAAGAFPLVLAESYASGWALDGLPAGWTARHLMVDGYANGWLVEGTGDAALRLRYRPAVWSSAALLVSLLGGAVTIAVLVGRWMLAVGRRRGWPGLGRRATP